MQPLLHFISKEFKNLKDISYLPDIEYPTIDGKNFSSGFNIFLASLWASNRSLKGDFSTLDFIKENNFKIEKNAPRIVFLSYNITNSLLFIEKNIQKYLPNFEKTDENIEKLQKIFQKGEIKSFSVAQKRKIEEDFGKTCEINFGKSILNYKKIEVTPNEFVIGLNFEKELTLSVEEQKIKEKIAEMSFENFDEALQYFYFSLDNFGIGNMGILKKFNLYELDLNTDFLIRADNNFILSKQIEKITFNQIKSI